LIGGADHLSGIKCTILALIWGGIRLSALTGYVGPTHPGLHRRDDPKFFWLVWSVGTGGALLATYLLWKTPI
jgi:hypothetical protein